MSLVGVCTPVRFGMDKPRNDEVQALYNMIAIMTDRLGGKAEFTFDELDNPPVTAELIRSAVDEKITIKIVKDDHGAETRP